MKEQLKAFLAKHPITTHSLAGTFATACVLYAAVPAFHDLVVHVYQVMPPWAHEGLTAGLGIYAFYSGSKKQAGE